MRSPEVSLKARNVSTRRELKFVRAVKSRYNPPFALASSLTPFPPYGVASRVPSPFNVLPCSAHGANTIRVRWWRWTVTCVVALCSAQYGTVRKMRVGDDQTRRA